MTVSALDSHLGYLLRMASNAVSHGFARRVEAESATVAEWAVLRMLYDETALAPSVLAERMGLTRGAVSKLAQRLIDKGLVARTDSNSDRRAHRLSLTDRGRGAVPALAALADAHDAAFFAVLDAGEREALRRLLEALIARRGLRGTPID